MKALRSRCVYGVRGLALGLSPEVSSAAGFALTNAAQGAWQKAQSAVWVKPGRWSFYHGLCSTHSPQAGMVLAALCDGRCILWTYASWTLKIGAKAEGQSLVTSMRGAKTCCGLADVCPEASHAMD